MKKYLILFFIIGLFNFPIFQSNAARVEIMGFEGSHSQECDLFSGTGSRDTTIVNSGVGSLHINPVGSATGVCRAGAFDAAGVTDNFSVNTVYHKFNFYAASLPTSTESFARAQSTTQTVKATLYLTSTGLINAQDSTNAASLGTSTVTLSAGTWYRIEMKVGNGTNAAFELKVDGVVEISTTGNVASNNNGYLSLGKVNNTNGADVDFYYDDISVDNTDYPGNTKVLSLKPSADGTTQQWTSGTGASDWSTIDEQVLDNTDYVMTTGASPETISQHNIEDTSVPGISGTINGLMILSVSREDVSGVSNNQIGIWSNGVIASTTGSNLTTGNRNLGKYQNTDPNTGSAWTTGGIDSAQIGFIDAASSTVQIRGVWIQMNVDFTPAAGGDTAMPINDEWWLEIWE